ncbi:MAG: hotdog fold thioesterase [Actinomycetia bacterium]|nr:hotdog fold thioesterase [Actinomycetes bacterium]MCP4959456.1 hotdog fold thioesterase [Actinomycetes bacterium]
MNPNDLFATDAAAAALGIEFIDGGPGHTELAMTVTTAMLNIADTCHGGVLFTLADSAMQITSNAGEAVAFASTANMHYIAPARSGDRLTASVGERLRRGKVTYHTGTIMGPHGVVALFDGTTIDVAVEST